MPRLVRQLGDLVRFVGGGTPSKEKSVYWNGNIPWASVKDMTSLELSETADSITESGLAGSASNLIPAGSVVMASRVSLGKVAMTKRPMAINQDLRALIPRDESLAPRFLLYMILASGPAIAQAGVGATVMGVNLEYLRELEIPLPPLEDQLRIVRILDEADVLRNLRQRANERAGQFAGALFDEFFGNPQTNPKGWPIVPVARFVKRFQAGRCIAPIAEQAGVAKYRILKISAVTWGQFRPEESKPLPELLEPEADQFVVPGDLLISRANTSELVGATVMVETTPPNLLLPDKLWRFVWGTELVEPRYVLTLFQHPATRQQLGEMATGTGGSMKNISMARAMALKVPFPPIALQRAFSSHISTFQRIRTRNNLVDQRVNALFESLLSRAFKGEL